MRSPRIWGVLLSALLLLSFNGRGQTSNLELVPPSEVPELGTFFLLSLGDGPPLPFNPYPGCNVYSLGDGRFAVDDREVAAAKALLEAAQTMDAEEEPPFPEDVGTNGWGGDIDFSPPVYGSNDLWLEWTALDFQNSLGTPTLHGTVESDLYQLLSQTNLSLPFGEWLPGQLKYGAGATNRTDFSQVSLADAAPRFYRAQHGDQIVSILPGTEAVEPDPAIGDPGRIGDFAVYGTGLTTDLTVLYAIGGTASNGVDYTNLTGVVTVPASLGYGEIFINPYQDNLSEGIESVEVRLIPTNTYLIDPAYSSASNVIRDVSMVVHLYPGFDAVEPDGPPGQPGRSGYFIAEREDSRFLFPELTVPYVLLGVAQNGVDYASLPGAFTFPDGSDSIYIYFDPLPDTLVEGSESVIMTLVASNGYALDPAWHSATSHVLDSSTVVSVFVRTNAIETNVMSTIPGRVGAFEVTREDPDLLYSSALTVSYSIGGTATPGVDYTNLSGTLTFGAGQTNAMIYIDTLSDDILEGDETVILTLVALQDSYMISVDAPSATLTIRDNVPFVPVLTNIPGPVGIDYHVPSNSLIVSYNYDTNGGPFNFARVYTNIVGDSTNVVVTNWSGVHGAADEVHFATVKENGGGFTNGDIFFGSNTGIGWLSSSGTTSNMNWCVLTNDIVTNALHLRGSLYVDRTGTFSNQLIAVASNGQSDPSTRKGVWRIDPLGHPTLLTNLLTPHLEGVITLTNDVQKWGPWAGKTITGDEDQVPHPVIYVVGTNGIVTSDDTTTLIPDGIYPEDFDIVPPNESLYLCDFDQNTILKLSAKYLTNYVGDLIVTDAGETELEAKLFIVHWDAATSSFVVRRVVVMLPGVANSHLEHVTFAPIELPAE